MRYIKKEDTKAGMIYDHTEMRYVEDGEVVDILNEKEALLKESLLINTLTEGDLGLFIAWFERLKVHTDKDDFLVQYDYELAKKVNHIKPKHK